MARSLSSTGREAVHVGFSLVLTIPRGGLPKIMCWKLLPQHNGVGRQEKVSYQGLTLTLK